MVWFDLNYTLVLFLPFPHRYLIRKKINILNISIFIIFGSSLISSSHGEKRKKKSKECPALTSQYWTLCFVFCPDITLIKCLKDPKSQKWLFVPKEKGESDGHAERKWKSEAKFKKVKVMDRQVWIPRFPTYSPFRRPQSELSTLSSSSSLSSWS